MVVDVVVVVEDVVTVDFTSNFSVDETIFEELVTLECFSTLFVAVDCSDVRSAKIVH